MSRPQTVHAHVPGNPALHLRSVPFAHATGAQWTGTRERTVEMRLPYARAVRAPGGAGVDPRAIMAVLDHACGVAVFASLDSLVPIATLDLRVAFQRAVPAGADIVLTARATHVEGMTAFVEAAAHAAGEGPALVTASGAFMVGAHPGGASKNEAGDMWQSTRVFESGDLSQLDSFDEFLCLARHGQHVRMEFSDRLIGAVSLPALHGGTVAALLATAAGDLAGTQGAMRLVAMTIQYLRAGRAETVTAAAEWEKRGARSGVVAAVARQSHGSREVARAQCTFVGDA